MAQKTFKSQRRLRCVHGQLTLNEVKAGEIVVGPEPGRTITVHDGWLRAIGGAAGGATAVDVKDTADPPTVAFKMAVGGLTENAVARVGLATHYTGTTVGSPLTPGEGLQIADDGVLTTLTHLDYCIFYTLES